MNPPSHSPDAEHEVAILVDHLFRRESGRLIAILTRHFGIKHLHLVEDVVQDALVKAMQTWPFTGVPQNPSVWLLQTAKHRALDHVRRDTIWSGKQEHLIPLMEDCLHAALNTAPPQFEDEICDSQLRMMFVCCHPGLSHEAQVALVLKTLCGFGEQEIAAAFLTSDAAITKRLVRARQFLREQDIAIELPTDIDLSARVETLLQALYLLFNEGYKASGGDSLLRSDLCAEAIRLTCLLVMHPSGNRPDAHALLALMHLNAARLLGRVDDCGNLLLMADQDRSRWDKVQIHTGLQQLALSSEGDRVTRYHLEAGLAACHCLAPDFASTDWKKILYLYDHLLELDGSPVAALNRAVAVAHVDGPRAGLLALEQIDGRSALENYHLYHAVAGQLWLETGDLSRAEEHFRQALNLAALPAERALLGKRLRQCSA